MKKQENRTRNLSPDQLGAVRAGVVPVVLGKSTFEEASSSRSDSELGLTTVEQQR